MVFLFFLRGGYLADIPARLKEHTPALQNTDVLINYGRELFWSGPVQGVVELTERERCKDEWWNEVVDELRRGQLSETNWQYLHGMPVEGCTLSDEERESRKRVITDPNDERLQLDRFKEAPVIVSNNDARYQINKDRARSHSHANKMPLYWSAAIDMASSAALQAENCDKDAKVRHESCIHTYVCTGHLRKHARLK